MIRTLKIPLYPTNEQIKLMNVLSDSYHNLGNLAVECIRDYAISNDKELRDFLVANYFGVNLSFIATVVAREKYFAFKRHGKVNFHKYKSNRKSFPVRCEAKDNRLSRIYSDDLFSIKIPTIEDKVLISRNFVNKYKRRYGDDVLFYLLNCKKQTARVIYDGKYWYLLFTTDLDFNIETSENCSTLGVDLGIKTLAVTSDGVFYDGVNKINLEVTRLESKIKSLQVILSRKLLQNNYNKTKNIKRLESKIYRYQRRLTNIRDNELHHISKELVHSEHNIIVFENLSVKDMMKKRKLKYSKDATYIKKYWRKNRSRLIGRQGWYKLYVYTKYKAEELGKVVLRIDRYYASTKTCSNCGFVRKFVTLGERIFKCPVCGFVKDRDWNAAINIANRGMIEYCNC